MYLTHFLRLQVGFLLLKLLILHSFTPCVLGKKRLKVEEGGVPLICFHFSI